MPERRDSDEDPESSYIKAKNAALRLLSYRSRSEKEVQRRLERRFTQDAVARTLSDLRRQGLLDDAAFAKEWRYQRERFRPRGPESPTMVQPRPKILWRTSFPARRSRNRKKKSKYARPPWFDELTTNGKRRMHRSF